MKYLARFPEDMYMPVKKTQEYLSMVLSGERIAEESSVVICGICRNVDNILPITKLRIEEIGNMFADYKVFVYENDSVDDTKDILRAWKAQNEKVEVYLEDYDPVWHNTGTGQKRLEDMARARNKYVEWSLNQDFDFMIVVDMDILGGYSYDGIKHSLAFMEKSGADFVGANSIYYRTFEEKVERLYYDTFAFSAVGVDSSEPEKNSLLFDRGEQPIEVESCFGGCGIYNAPFSFQYKSDDCDHVTMHRQMREQGQKIFINPSLITLYNDTIYSHSLTQGEYVGLGPYTS